MVPVFAMIATQCCCSLVRSALSNAPVALQQMRWGSSVARPKLKSHKGMKKRFRITKSGRIKYKKGGQVHFMRNKNRRHNLALGATAYLQPGKHKKMIKRIKIGLLARRSRVPDMTGRPFLSKEERFTTFYGGGGLRNFAYTGNQEVRKQRNAEALQRWNFKEFF